MRKLIYAINHTIDGCLDHTKQTPDAEMMEFWTNFISQAGALAYGRITYQLMVPYWPDLAKDPSQPKDRYDFAGAFDSVPKLVFSKTLTSVQDKNSTLIRTDLKDEILKLKQAPGKDIQVGGVSLPSQLMKLGLIDEYYFLVHPVIVGAGRRLFEGDLKDIFKLKLLSSKPFKSGIIANHYINR
jgi:dihydrofolate reductase